ncbi:MAG: DUF4160 domain-containing protein [Rickettsiales bacterium]
MPEISRFFGIVICMFANEHAPAHFHAYYQDFEIAVEIETGIVDGRFPPSQLRSVLDWCELHRDELMENWNIAVGHGILNKIKPL